MTLEQSQQHKKTITTTTTILSHSPGRCFTNNNIIRKVGRTIA